MEFKVNKQLGTQVESLRKSSNKINDSYSAVSKDGVSTLDTSMAIIQQHKDIKKLLDLYKSLLVRDANDLDAMIKEVDAMDATMSVTKTC